MIVLLAPVTAEARKVYPVDQGPRDRSFVAFRDRLLAAARRHDRRFIYSIVSPDIEFTFGDDRGRRAFIRSWNEEPKGALERELIDVLSLGGVWANRRVFWAPYVYAAEGDIGEAVILGKNVRVRRHPSVGAPVVATLSYDVVRIDLEHPVSSGDSHPAWVRITMSNGKDGYVADRYIRSFIDYRAFFEKRRGQWWMTVFIAGD